MIDVGDREKAAACRLDSALLRADIAGQATVRGRSVTIDVPRQDESGEGGAAIANVLAAALELVNDGSEEFARRRALRGE